MTPERQQLVDHARALWNKKPSSEHVLTLMALESYSPAEVNYIKRYLKQ